VGDAFSDLPDGGPDYVWNNDYNTAAEIALKNYKLRFYARQTAAQASGAETPFTLIKGGVYTPRNATGQQQKNIIALHLVALRECMDYWDSRRMSIPRSIPSSYVVKVQGNPGAGKTFILCTTCNMTRNVFGKMDFDMATVTTGVAADLICGETHIRGYSTPTQRKLSKLPPKDITHQSVQKKKAFVRRFARKFHVIFDEDSMIGRETFAWLLHRLKEGRRGLSQPGMDINHGDISTRISSPFCMGSANTCKLWRHTPVASRW
jgi:hypothetical protein